MLKSVLAPETCAKCRNCCVFEEQSTWELPTFSADAIAKIQSDSNLKITLIHDKHHIELPKGAGTQPCPFLDEQSGCTLPPDEKPFACSIWPVRVMIDGNGRRMLTLYRGCSGIPQSKISALTDLLRNGLKSRICEEIEKDETLILPYHSNYQILEYL